MAEQEIGQTFPPPMAKPRNKKTGPKCFTCGQMGHFQRVGPHMECTWVKALKGQEVMTIATDKFTRLVVPVCLNRQEVDSLVDMGCGRTLVWQVMGPP